MCKRVGDSFFLSKSCLLLLLLPVGATVLGAFVGSHRGKGCLWLVVELPRVVGPWERQMMIMMLSYALLML
ncbi:hypothetical protein BO85DRAFT_445171 [Aspergillus piperis CBS 112811]|uniref:Uncharacterized protein n=1 Tax=Aspergillus piperis CBS 112811 TaxID=1448313 RepID=A0A8G1RAV3_9EURO|nr:hypothetical protein BO85DRAFT_445171 [Aspergillus piperis CBS 112811]RAH61771.1 hypothetical protein BO85DRAFT_445171 [Aspergillus piperis CBS 112811]